MLITPTWLRCLLAAAMLAVTGYHLARGLRQWCGPRRAVPLSDAWHGAMAVGMGLMVLGVTRDGPGWWMLVFAVPAVLLAWRALDRYVVGGVPAAAGHLRHLVAAVAMSWMLAPVVMPMPAGSSAAGAAGRPSRAPLNGHAMAGMDPDGGGSGTDPAVLAVLVRSVTILLLLAVLLLAARSCWALLPRRSPVRSVGVVSARRSSAWASWHGCQLAMHVTAVVMLAAMV